MHFRPINDSHIVAACRLATIIPEAAVIARDATKRLLHLLCRIIAAKDQFIIGGSAARAATIG